MKIELTDNKVFFEKQGAKKEIHPFWLRERVNSENFLDQKTQQRLFDPTMLKNSSEISKVNISDKFLEVSFKDGSYAKLVIENILKEFEKDNELYFINKISWKSDFQNNNIYKFNKNFFEEKIMYDLKMFPPKITLLSILLIQSEVLDELTLASFLMLNQNQIQMILPILHCL